MCGTGMAKENFSAKKKEILYIFVNSILKKTIVMLEWGLNVLNCRIVGDIYYFVQTLNPS